MDAGKISFSNLHGRCFESSFLKNSVNQILYILNENFDSILWQFT